MQPGLLLLLSLSSFCRVIFGDQEAKDLKNQLSRPPPPYCELRVGGSWRAIINSVAGFLILFAPECLSSLFFPSSISRVKSESRR